MSNDDYTLTHVSGTVGWQQPNGRELLVSANVGRDERGFPGPFGSNPIGVFPGVDRVSRVSFKATGDKLGTLFDGSQQLISVTAIPWYSRQVSLPMY